MGRRGRRASASGHCRSMGAAIDQHASLSCSCAAFKKKRTSLNLCIADISVQCSARNQERVYQTNRTEECLQGFLDERLTLLKARVPCVHAQRAAVRKDCDAMRMRSCRDWPASLGRSTHLATMTSCVLRGECVFFTDSSAARLTH